MAPDTEGLYRVDGTFTIERPFTEAEIYEFVSTSSRYEKLPNSRHPNGGSKHGFQRSWRPGKKGRR